MSRIADILTRARDSLADPSKERWTDARLVRLIDEAQKTVARRFELFRGEVFIGLDTDRAVYPLPDDVWRITRAAVNGVAIPMYTYDEMDRKDPTWMSHTGPEICAIVFNNRSLNEIRIYPMPDENFQVTYYDIEPIYGVTNEVYLEDSQEASVGQIFGVLSNVVDRLGDTLEFSSPFGVVADVATLVELQLQYVRDPLTVVTDLNNLELPTAFDSVIKHYVIGMAFLDDLDSQNQERGQGSLALYEREVELLGNKTGPTNGTRAPNVRSGYRGFQ